MIRKLFSMLLCAFALLLLMGAGTVPQQAAATLEKEESAPLPEAALETASQSMDQVSGAAVHAAVGANPLEMAKNTGDEILIDGEYVSAELGRKVQDGVTYVSLAAMATQLDETAQTDWDAESGTAVVTTEGLELTAQVGQHYLEANGRYLYLPEQVQLADGQASVPLWAVTRAFDAQVSWDAETGVTSVTRGSGAIVSGEDHYDEESLFWLSRVIFAESGNQPMEGKIAVGNVVLNRVASPGYPDTVEGVLAQKNQFTTYKNGKLADRTPNTSSVIAAKLVLDGAVVEETEGALYFDSAVNSWASRNKECVAVIGDHKFYR